MKRRKSLKLISSLPIVALFPSVLFAKDAKKDASKTAPKKARTEVRNLISEKDTLAKAMQYKNDAAKAPAMRTNRKAFCYNCTKYNVCMDGDKKCKLLSVKDLQNAEYAPCQIFKAKVVAKDGWCLSWQAKA